MGARRRGSEAGRVGTRGATYKDRTAVNARRSTPELQAQHRPIHPSRVHVQRSTTRQQTLDIMQLSLFVTALASLAASAFAADPLTIDTPCVFSVHVSL